MRQSARFASALRSTTFWWSNRAHRSHRHSELVPTLNLNPANLPVLAGLWHKDGATARHDAVAWGYARGATQRGVELHQLTEVTDVLVSKGRVTALKRRVAMSTQGSSFKR